jgi:hypothetical protein
VLGGHLAPGPLGDFDVEQVGGHDERLVVAVEVELEDILVVGRGVEPSAQALQALGQPVPLVVEGGIDQSLSP